MKIGRWSAGDAGIASAGGRARTARSISLRAIEGLAALALVAALVVVMPDDPVSSVGPTERRPMQPVTGAPDTWLVMIYADAEDQLIEEDVVFSVNEAELVGSSAQVKIVAQLDRCQGGYEGDGGDSGTRRYVIEKDDDLHAVDSRVVGAPREVDMGSAQTLYDFACWAIAKYPSEHHALLMVDHGGAWQGGWVDDLPFEGSSLTIPELDATFGAIVADTGIGALELVGFDACLMSQVEVMSALAPHARYAVASEETATALGFSYASLLQALVDDPSMTGAELGEVMVESFIEEKVRLTDDEERLSYMGEDWGLQDTLEYFLADCTMAAIDLSKMGQVNEAVNALAVALSTLDQQLVAKAKTYAQTYESLPGAPSPSRPGPPSLVDVGSLAEMLSALTADPGVAAACVQVEEALSEAVVSDKHGPDRPGSTGMAIYFPQSLEYEWCCSDDEESYARSVGRFATASLWDDYLTSHFTGRSLNTKAFDLSVLLPEQAGRSDLSKAAGRSALAGDDEVAAPGARGVELSGVTVSEEQIGPRDVVKLSAQVSGDNIADVFFYAAFYSEEDDYYYCAEAGYVECPEVEEVGGLDMLHWGKGEPVPVQLEWRPALYFLIGGDDEQQIAFVDPDSLYRAGPGNPLVITGEYQSANTGDVIYAELEFYSDAQEPLLWGYCPSPYADVDHWHQLLPRPGDTFTVTNEFVDYGSGPGSLPIDYYGCTVTFGERPLRLVLRDAWPGEYALCVGIEDMDGNYFWDYATVKVTD